jgi:predicted transcriptional regulator
MMAPALAPAPCSAVYQFATNFTSGVGTKATVGFGGSFPLYNGNKVSQCIQQVYNVHIMPESSVLTLRLDAKLKNQLDRLSKSMNRSRSFVAAQAIQEFVSVNEWQIAEIKKAIASADRGEFASEKQVQQTLKRWTRRAT